MVAVPNVGNVTGNKVPNVGNATERCIMKQKVTFMALDLSGDSRARAARFKRAIKALGKAEASVWTTMCAIVRADGLDGIPSIPRECKTAANAASELRKLAKLGKLSELFKEGADGAVLAMSQRDVRALIKAAAKKAAAKPADAPNVGSDDLPSASDMEPAADEIDTAVGAKHAADVLAQRTEVMRAALEQIARMKGKAGDIARAAIEAAEALK